MVRTHTNKIASSSKPSPSSSTDPQAFSSKHSELRAKLRAAIDAKVYERSKGRVKKMGWKKRSYRRVVVKAGIVLRGWPCGSDGIPFQNLSYVKGGKAVMQRLTDAWESGELHFEEATEEEVDLARRCPNAVLPGDAPVLPVPQCWGPFVRNDMGLTRDPTKKKQKTGPKTPKIVPYEPVDDAEEIESGDESESDSIEAAVWSSDAERDRVSDIEEFDD